jgi:hypothetical protein
MLFSDSKISCVQQSFSGTDIKVELFCYYSATGTPVGESKHRQPISHQITKLGNPLLLKDVFDCSL